MIHDEWRHRAHAADDLLADIAAVCRGEMPPEPREGGSEAHRAAWVAVCALRSEVAAERAAERAAIVAWLRDEARCRFISDEVAMRIERGEHRREGDK